MAASAAQRRRPANRPWRSHPAVHRRRPVRPCRRYTSCHACAHVPDADHWKGVHVALELVKKQTRHSQFSRNSRRTSHAYCLPIDAEKPPPKPFDGSSGLKSPMPRCPPIGRQPPPKPFFFFDFELSLRLRVCMPSFFMVSGRLTCG